MRRLLCIALLVVVSLGLTACSSRVQDGQTDASLGLGDTIDAQHSVGQTFVSRFAGLTTIEVSAAILGNPGSGKAVLHLRSDPDATSDLRTAESPFSPVGGAIAFVFPPLPDSAGRPLYFVIEGPGMPAGSALEVARGTGASYPDGALYADGAPQDRQVAFRLKYDPISSALGDAWFWLQAAGMLSAALLLFVLPGLALLTVAMPGRSWAWAEALGLAGALGLCIYPLLLLWSSAAGWRLGPGYVWVCIVGGLLVLVFSLAVVLRRHARRLPWRQRFTDWWIGGNRWPDLALLVIVLLVAARRLSVLAWLDAPSWGDSVQHAVIAQLMVDHGGLFSSWLPYAPYGSMTVHFGFHSAVAAYQWLTGAPAAWATLATGQLLNILAVVTLIPLALRVGGGNRWAAAAAVLAAGLVSPVPAVYVNWGRYAQLAGQAILPVAAWFVWDLLDRRDQRAGGLILAAVAMAGMTLAYYRMPYLLAPWVVCLVLAWGLPRWRSSPAEWSRAFVLLAFAAGLMLVLVSPWAGNLLGGKLATMVVPAVGASGAWTKVVANYQSFQDLVTFVPPVLAVPFLLTAAWALVRRQAPVLGMILWTVGLCALPALWLLGVPGANMLDSFAVMIALYIPVGVVVGVGAGRLAQALAGSAASWRGLLTASVLVAVAAWGAYAQGGLLERTKAIVTRPDILAMDWIRNNTPPDARFLVQGFAIYSDSSIVGADGGWWIPLLAGRQNTMPPQYALMDERPLQAGYSQAMTDLVIGLRASGATSRRGLDLICAAGVTHIYQGQGHGSVGANAIPLYSSGELAASSALQPVYKRDRVEIYALAPGVCK